MSNAPDPSTRYRLRSLKDKGAIGKLGLIGAIILGVVVCFAYVAGWLSPNLLTPAGMVDAFQEVNGVHPGFRRNHAKGVCIAGYFESNGQGARFSTAAVFPPGRVPVIGRFAFSGGKPYVPDSPTLVRSLALSFRPFNGEEWRTAMVNIPVFTVKNVDGFHDQILASKPDPATGKPDPAKMTAFFAAHPEAVAASRLIKAKPFSSGFANADYNALNTFRFINAAGVSTPVRWSAIAVEPFEPETPDQTATPDKNYLFDAVIARIERGPLQWRLVVAIGQAGDPTNNATLPWPDDREHVDVGTLTIDHVESEAPGNCRDVNFDPLVLPAGIEPSDDPLLSARSGAYSNSFTRRAGEKKEPSAVQTSVAGKGA